MRKGKISSLKVWASTDYSFLHDQKLSVGALSEVTFEEPVDEATALEDAKKAVRKVLVPSMAAEVKELRCKDSLIDLGFKVRRPETVKRLQRRLKNES